MTGLSSNTVAKLALSAATMLLLACSPAASEFEVIDGDTLRRGEERIRLWGIDAPEGRQVCQRDGREWLPGPEAAQALRELVANIDGQLRCGQMSRPDRFGRTVAECRYSRGGIGLTLNEQMVRLGWAWEAPRYSAGAYAAAEREARDARRGIWSAQCVAPWEWRREQRR